MMSYPIVFRVENEKVVVVGGGRVSTRRVRRLAEAGARVAVVSPDLTEPLREMVEAGQIEWFERGYRAGDLDGAAMVIAATDDRSVNRRVAGTARRAKIPVNVADAPEEGTFSVPAMLELGPLRMTIDTGGAAPALSAALRRHLEETLSPGWAKATVLAGKLRPIVARQNNEVKRAEFWRRFCADLPDALLATDAEVAAWLAGIAEETEFELGDVTPEFEK